MKVPAPMPARIAGSSADAPVPYPAKAVAIYSMMRPDSGSSKLSSLPAETCWTVDECVAAVGFLKGKHPGLRGGYLWELGRPGTAAWASRVGPLLLG